MSIGIDLNNPFDIEVSPYFRWQGEIVATTGTVDNFCHFDTIEDGLRAGFKDLYNAWKMDGFSTLRQLVFHYAPPDKNDSIAYLSGVCATTGWGADDPLDLSTQDNLATLGRAFLIQEQGKDYVASIDAATLNRAVTSALAA